MTLPTYEFQCQCGVRFDAHAAITKRKDPQPCPSCAKLSDPVPPSTVQGHFNKEVTGAGPQNTGIQGLDAHIDRTIGASAKQGWDVAEGRKRDKLDLLSGTGASGHDLSRNVDGSYRIMKPDERAVHDRNQAIQTAAGAWRKSRRR